MAKFKRFDPRNKKANNHKRKVKEGYEFKRLKESDSKKVKYHYEQEIVRTQGD